MEKRGLGRGLAALMSESLMEPEGEGIVREIPLAQITANPMQPRTLFDPIKLEELAASIREHGVLQPVLVRRMGHDRYQLLAGERRFRAAQSAGKTEIAALIKECSEKQQLEIAIVENLQREDIGAMEAARAYMRMSIEFGMTQEAIAARVGKSRTAVTNTMGLLDLPEEIQDSLEIGQITEGHARALKGIKLPEAILDAWRIVVHKSLSVRDTEKMAREARTRRSDVIVGVPTRTASTRQADPGDFTPDPNEAYLINRLQETLKTKVVLRRTTGQSGKIEIVFYSNEDLERIVEALVPIT